MANDSQTQQLIEFNKAMVRVAEELGSKYAKYPIQYSKWFDPAECVDGKPCFVASNDDIGVRLDYMFCHKGPLGPGYYHMLTKIAYNSLYSRVSSTAPSQGCCCFGDSRAYNEFNGVKIVVYNRTVSRIPDDVRAKRDGMDRAKELCEVWYQGTQNEQLALNAVQTGVNLNLAS